MASATAATLITSSRTPSPTSAMQTDIVSTTQRWHATATASRCMRCSGSTHGLPLMMTRALLGLLLFLFLTLSSSSSFVSAQDKTDLLPAWSLLDLEGKGPVQRWARISLVCIKQEFPFLHPTAVARCATILSQAMFDVTTFYRDDWVRITNMSLGEETCPGGGGWKQGRLPPFARTDANYAISIAYASYNVLVHSFQTRSVSIQTLNDQMDRLGLSVATSALEDLDISSPRGIGNAVAKAVLDAYKDDGMNELGDQPGTRLDSEGHGIPYADYTNYFPVNDPQVEAQVTDCSTLRDLNHWQPLRVPRPPAAGGGTVVQTWSGPYIGRVRPFALTHGAQFRPPIPPTLGVGHDDEVKRQVKEIMDIQANLSDEEKAIAEYWADGPDSTLPPGHWVSIALQLAEHRNSTEHETVHQLMLVSAALFDAGIAAWDAKRYYDSARPLTLIQCLFGAQGEQGLRWAGPYKGVQTLPFSRWIPYQNPYFVTPPFAEYISGHSTFSFAAATILKQYWASDDFHYRYTIKAGSSLFEPKIEAGEPGHIPGVTDAPNSGPRTVGYSPAQDVTLEWSGLIETAEQCGYSRRLGGIHFETGDLTGRRVGAQVAQVVWDKIQRHVNPTQNNNNNGNGNGRPSVVNINFANMFNGMSVTPGIGH